ncbi:MAG: 23S rRNA (pseudouridine(1915)-N(3))-methyltransferase RlmH [Solirubrobacterales bacterium]|nr:23S rRNA (pseudouridine(1915)-N(3))-methyltransferase RlmH [Solirubrobacterales bacterium]HMT04771.1 23S rRNA (pseudouridine(1915)-N(3))-methyltransferase RlmH [Solirubrobacterales bacterium]
MKVELVAVGKIRPPFTEAEDHYLKLLKPLQPIEVTEVRDDTALVRKVNAARATGGSHPDPGTLVALEAGGQAMTSERWARWLGERRHEGRRLTLLIGGPGGLPAELSGEVGHRLSLGPQTMAHQLARIVLLEQIFRANKILAGQKYHL